VAHTEATGISAIRLEALADPSLVKGGPGRAGNGNFALSDFRLTIAPLSGGRQPPERKFAKTFSPGKTALIVETNRQNHLMAAHLLKRLSMR
jgi:hypothetical protein